VYQENKESLQEALLEKEEEEEGGLQGMDSECNDIINVWNSAV